MIQKGFSHTNWISNLSPSPKKNSNKLFDWLFKCDTICYNRVLFLICLRSLITELLAKPDHSECQWWSTMWSTPAALMYLFCSLWLRNLHGRPVYNLRAVCAIRLEWSLSLEESDVLVSVREDVEWSKGEKSKRSKMQLWHAWNEALDGSPDTG